MHRERGRNRSASSDRSRTRNKKDKKEKKDKKRKKEHRRDYSDEDCIPRYERRQPDGFQQKRQAKEEPPKEEIIKQKPCWQPSGILVQFYNAREGVSLKFHQPPQSRPPQEVWRIYIIKGDQVFQPILLTDSCYLFGKDDRVCDVLCQNDSISRQHAVIQFRLVIKQLQDGTYSEQVKPYLMDLQSTNGTTLNGEKIEPSRYIQLLQKDVIRFGFSQRDYVIVREDGSMRPQQGQEEYQ